jgi:hypothetical protein
MAYSEFIGTTWLNVVLDDTAVDYQISKAILLRAVRFYPSAANDKLTIMQEQPGTASTSWPFFTLISLDGGPIAMFEPDTILNPNPAWYWIDYSKCTFTTPANCIVQFVINNM